MSLSKIYYCDCPCPPPDYDEHNNTESNNAFVSLISFVISAFEWKPNTLGWMICGNV